MAIKAVYAPDAQSCIKSWGINPDDVIAWLEKQGKTSPILYNSSNNGKVEQKPTFEMKTPEESLGIDSDTYNKIVDECVYGEQNPAWSEENEAMWAEISNLLWEGYKHSGSKFSWDDIRNWVNPKLKSLSPQNRWKPSDEQISVLEFVMEDIEKDSIRYAVLNSVLEQLKKLRE